MHRFNKNKKLEQQSNNEQQRRNNSSNKSKTDLKRWIELSSLPMHRFNKNKKLEQQSNNEQQRRNNSSNKSKTDLKRWIELSSLPMHRFNKNKKLEQQSNDEQQKQSRESSFNNGEVPLSSSSLSCIFLISGSPASHLLRVFARVLDQGTVVEIQCLETDTVGDVKAVLALKLSCPIDRLRLLFAGLELERDTQLLTEIGINSESLLTLFLSPGTPFLFLLYSSISGRISG